MLSGGLEEDSGSERALPLLTLEEIVVDILWDLT